MEHHTRLDYKKQARVFFWLSLLVVAVILFAGWSFWKMFDWLFGKDIVVPEIQQEFRHDGNPAETPEVIEDEGKG